MKKETPITYMKSLIITTICISLIYSIVLGSIGFDLQIKKGYTVFCLTKLTVNGNEQYTLVDCDKDKSGFRLYFN